MSARSRDPRMHPDTRYVMVLRDRTYYELAEDGAVLYRSDGPGRSWNYGGRWIILGFAKRAHSARIVPLAAAAAGADVGHGWIHDRDHGSRRMWASPSSHRVMTVQTVEGDDR